MPVTVYPKGTTIYCPEKCFNGYSLILVPGADNMDAGLIDMNGAIVHRWTMASERKKAGFPRLRLLPDGRLLVLRSVGNRIVGYAQEFDWDGALVWEYSPPAGLWPHHDIEKTATGNTLLICRELVPEAIRAKAKEPERRAKLYADVIQEISPDKQVVWEWHQYDHLDIDRKASVFASPAWWFGPENNTLVDWVHTNTIQALPPNRWFDAGDTRFKPGNLLMSSRALDVVLIVDRDTKQIVWEYTGDYRGGLSGQHDSHMIEKGLPGEGNILIFDNGASPTKDLSHCGASFVLEIDPTTQKVVWVYDKREQFHSNFTSSCQRLPNGNTLILESAHSRLFEVARECETVWEYVFAWQPHSARAYRYGYDFCPQTRALGRPEERPVAPAF
ncbi:MAG: aryl-sulfate sulfotransferase [Candidatus Sumerlaeota bacterium]|nr:aryl-sulfate sulfotransferase [Candidatus Sumerlaeota bacterium]